MDHGRVASAHHTTLFAITIARACACACVLEAKSIPMHVYEYMCVMVGVYMHARVRECVHACMITRHVHVLPCVDVAMLWCMCATIRRLLRDDGALIPRHHR